MTFKEHTVSELNDQFRGGGSGITLTQGASALPHVMGLLWEISRYDKFTPDNDPYGEHDFGTIKWKGQKVFWKIDYYDEATESWADPLSSTCHRVLTVMLAEEY
jgi:hypothetical protein